MNGKLSQSSSKTASLLCRSADKASRVPEKNRRSCASFTVRENTAALNSQDPVSKLATLRKNERIPLSQAVMTPAEVLLSRLRCFPCSHCHCCGWMWREKVQRTEPSTSTERMVHSVRKSLQSILLYYKTGRKRNVWTTLPAKIWVFLTYFLRMCVCVWLLWAQCTLAQVSFDSATRCHKQNSLIQYSRAVDCEQFTLRLFV